MTNLVAWSQTLRIVWHTFVSHCTLMPHPETAKCRYYLVILHRSVLGMNKSCRSILFPYPIISPFFHVACTDKSAEWFAAKQKDYPTHFENTMILLPQLIKWNYAIPIASSSAVWQIAHNAIHASVRNTFHSFEAVFIIYLIQFYHCLFTFSLSFPFPHSPPSGVPGAPARGSSFGCSPGPPSVRHTSAWWRWWQCKSPGACWASAT